MEKTIATNPPPDAPASTVSVTFWGAARTVTGSMHLVEVGPRKLLLDCGLYQGKRSEARDRNSRFPFAPRDINAMILSHAHLDHCGNIPNLVRQGFDGPIFCTPATRDLVAIMLEDSAKIQEEDAAYLNRKNRQGQPPVQPLYDRRDVQRTMRLFHTVPYDRAFAVLNGIQANLVDAGHLLGSAMVALTIAAGGRERSITFTGDLGRRGLPILRDPAPVPAGELLISESTYGGRTHEPVDLLAESLLAVVKRTYERGGKLLIPAFSLGRTQAVVFFLHQLIERKQLPNLPIYVDSPLAANATEVFRLHSECFDEETASLLLDNPDLFGQRHVRYTRSVEESKQLNGIKDPCIIIAASGMCEAGRILHHLKHNIEDARNTVLIIGFQAPDTLGRRLVDKQPEVRILDKFYKLRAEVTVMNGFSSHADQGDFQTFLSPLASKTQHVRLVHGEMDQMDVLAKHLAEWGFKDVASPDRGEKITLN